MEVTGLEKYMAIPKRDKKIEIVAGWKDDVLTEGRGEGKSSFIESGWQDNRRKEENKMKCQKM
jgi:hypothetical protein